MLNVVYWVRGAEFAKMASISARSMKRIYEDAKVFVYADEEWPEFESDAVDEVICLPIQNTMPSMVANLHGQVHYVINENFNRTTLFCDADVLASTVAPLSDNTEHDLMVTKREYVGIEDGEKIIGVSQKMPYNYGVVLANPTQGAKEIFIWMRERVVKMGSHLQDWYGNQWALRELVGGQRTEEAPRVVKRNMAWGPVSIKIENCSTWNYTPEGEDTLADKYFVHAKGERKELFYEIADKLEKGSN